MGSTEVLEETEMVIIPRLPNEIALRVLVRLPRTLYGRFRSVSRSWRAILQPNNIAFNTLRKELNISQACMLFLSPQLDHWHFSFIDLAVRGYREVVLPPPPPPFRASMQDRLLLSEPTTGFHIQYPCMVHGSKVFIPSPYCNEPSVWRDNHFERLCCFDVRSMKWRKPMPLFTHGQHRRQYYACTAMDNYVYAAGGHSYMQGDNFQKQVERLDIKTNKWEAIQDMHMKRVLCSVFVMQGRLYVLGGFPDRGKHQQLHNSGEMWDPKSKQWTFIPDLWPMDTFNAYKRVPSFVVVSDVLYAIKEGSHWRQHEIMYYMEASGQWMSLGEYYFELLVEKSCGIARPEGLDYKFLGMGHELLVLCYSKRPKAPANNTSSLVSLSILSTVPSPPHMLSPWRAWSITPQVDPSFTPLILHV